MLWKKDKSVYSCLDIMFNPRLSGILMILGCSFPSWWWGAFSRFLKLQIWRVPFKINIKFMLRNLEFVWSIYSRYLGLDWLKIVKKRFYFALFKEGFPFSTSVCEHCWSFVTSNKRGSLNYYRGLIVPIH